MIVVTVELKSAVHNSRDKVLARMEICNDDESKNPNRGNYNVRTLRGRSEEQFLRRVTNRSGRVTSYPRLAVHVWHLVAEALDAMRYMGRPLVGQHAIKVEPRDGGPDDDV